MKRRTRRIIATSIFLGSAMLAYAALPPDVRPEPQVLVLQQLSGGSAMGNLVLHNYGATATAITALTPTGPDCMNVTAMGTPFTLGSASEGANAMRTATVNCNTSTFGVHRCEFDAMDNTIPRATFTVLCRRQGSGGPMGTLTAPMTTFAFGNVPVLGTSTTKTVQVVNASMATITSLSMEIDDQADNYHILNCPSGPGCTLSGLNIPPTAFYNIQVQCTPTVAGNLDRRLYVVAGSGPAAPQIDLTCNGTSGGLGLSRTTVPLMVQVNASMQDTVVIANDDPANPYIVTGITKSGAGGGAWTFSSTCAIPCTLNPSESLTLTTTFSPLVHGPLDAKLTITTTDPNLSSQDVDLDGTGLGATLTLQSNLGMPPTLDLGTRPIGVPAAGSFQLRNGGNQTLTSLTYMLQQTGTEFSVTSAPTMITPGGTPSVMVQCIPSAAQQYSATLTFMGNAYTGSPLSIELACTGTSGNLYADPANYDFDEIRIGTTPVTKTFTLRTGATDLTLMSNPVLQNPPANMTVGVPTSQTVTMSPPYTTFDVTIVPLVDTPSLATSISVTAAPNDTIAIPIIGKVVTPEVAATPAIMIGSFCVGRPTATTEARLTATGTATIALPSLPYMAGMASSAFSLATPNYPASLKSQEFARVEITPLLRTQAGMVTDSVVWTTDAPGAMMMPTTDVTAQFVANGGAISPQLLDFDGAALRHSAGTRVIRLQNCGTEPLDLRGVTIAPSGEFRDVTGDPLPASLAYNQIASIVVEFIPTRTGTRTATLTVDSSEGNLTVNLAGIGLGDNTGDGDQISFYACDCTTSDPSSAWPILIVMIVLRRKRRMSPCRA